MTREEAIEVLENGEWWEELAEWYMIVHPEHDKLHDAVDMAISALRQQETVTEHNELTNAQKIRAMSDEELALWICGVYDIEEEHGKFINGIIIPGYAPHDIEEWLQQPAEEDDHER